MFDSDGLIGARRPGHMRGTPLPTFEEGRTCECGSKISRYEKADKCWLCQKEPGRAARLERERAEAEMLGRLWKSKEYPDGCRDCDADRRFKRRHMGKGFCSLHYQRRKRAGTLDDLDQRVAAPPTDAAELERTLLWDQEVRQPIGGTEETYVHVEGHEEPEALTSYVHGAGCPFNTDSCHAIYRGNCICTVREIEEAWSSINDDNFGMAQGHHISSTGEGTGYTNPLRTPPDPDDAQCCGERPEGDADCGRCPQLDKPREEVRRELTDRYCKASENGAPIVFFGPSDLESLAITEVARVLELLDKDARKRVLTYSFSRFGI